MPWRAVRFSRDAPASGPPTGQNTVPHPEPIGRLGCGDRRPAITNDLFFNPQNRLPQLTLEFAFR
jgi:hypothetical protein